MKVAGKQCASCIYRPNSPLNLKKLEAQVADPYIEGFFKGHRICHHFQNDSRQVCCRGFWDRHKDSFALGQIAQRLGFVEMIATETHEGSKRRRERKRLAHKQEVLQS